MRDPEKKREHEKQVVAQMIAIYCRKKHPPHCRHLRYQELCPQCRKLLDYAWQRSEKCPFMETKTFCSNCRVHCYKSDMREKIRDVMAFSGPRMIFHHPIITICHMLESHKEKKQLEERV